MNSLRSFTVLAAFALLATSAFALNIAVRPTSGTPGANPTTTIADAITQINAGADASNTITLRSTEGAHILPANATWVFAASKDVNFVAESGRPVIRFSSGGALNLAVTLPATSNLTFTGIDWIPQAGQAYANNTNDGIQFNNTTTLGGNVSFTDCIFTYNDGSDGPGAVTAFTGTNCVGDDWIYALNLESLTFSNCLITGCNDDALLWDCRLQAAAKTLTLNQGTAIAEVGGAGIQLVRANSTLVIDGAAGRVQIANCGIRSASSANDVAIKSFWDAGVTITINRADIVGSTNGLIGDYEGVEAYNLTDSRFAFGNSLDVGGPSQGLLSICDTSNDSAYAIPVNITRCTFHDGLGASLNPFNLVSVGDNASDPAVNWTIIDSIFSGAGDTFALIPATAFAGSSVSQSFSAVVTAGPHAVAGVGDLGAGAVSADPQYTSLTYTIGRSQDNNTFLRPTNWAAYGNTGSAGSKLKGGCPDGSTLPMELSVFSTN